MKPIEIASVIFSVLSLISGAAMWLLFRKYPSVDFSNASGTEKWLKVITGVVFLLSILLDFVFSLFL